MIAVTNSFLVLASSCRGQHADVLNAGASCALHAGASCALHAVCGDAGWCDRGMGYPLLYSYFGLL